MSFQLSLSPAYRKQLSPQNGAAWLCDQPLRVAQAMTELARPPIVLGGGVGAITVCGRTAFDIGSHDVHARAVTVTPSMNAARAATVTHWMSANLNSGDGAAADGSACFRCIHDAFHSDSISRYHFAFRNARNRVTGDVELEICNIGALNPVLVNGVPITSVGRWRRVAVGDLIRFSPKPRNEKQALEFDSTRLEFVVEKAVTRKRRLEETETDENGKKRRYPSTATRAAETILAELTCAICLEPIVLCRALTCGHLFCRRCIQPWIDPVGTCPTCRAVCKSYPLPAVDSAVATLVEAHLSDADKAAFSNRRFASYQPAVAAAQPQQARPAAVAAAAAAQP